MKFQLDFSFSSSQKISARQQLTLIGSCFAENIGQKFSQVKFNSLTNPYGIIFNPLSLVLSLNEILDKKKYTEADLFQQGELSGSFSHHGVFSSADKNSVLHKINFSIENAHNVLQKEGWLIVTFGSAYVYKHKKLGRVVANCHKFPGSEFEKKLLASNEIVLSWKQVLQRLRRFNPLLKIIFTVSPVRYVRDGLVQNNLSKSALLLAVNELCASENAIYFPAYEIVNDVLRDYRFFKEDLVHPSLQAIEFVWQKFSDGFFDEETQRLQKKMEAYWRSENHIALHPGTKAEDSFKRTQGKEKQDLQKTYPYLNWE